MNSISYEIHIGRTLLMLCVAGWLGGCSTLGPAVISNGRLAYNEAINQTNNQQMLMLVIHSRYQETGSLLAVASVTANVSVTTNAGIQLGLGDSDSYAGNLVPFSAGAIYEENPTISYSPVAGEQYFRYVTSPLPLAVLAQLTGSVVDPAYIYTALVSSVNGIRNPGFLPSRAEPDPRFGRFVEIMTALTRAHRLHWINNPDQDGGFLLVIDHYASDFGLQVTELLRLLGLPAPKDRSSRIVLPVFLALDGRQVGGIGIATRSVFELTEILSAAIEVPEEEQRAGMVADYPSPGEIGRELRVRHAADRPEQAAVAVKYRGGWFYIDQTDRATKRFFKLLAVLWSVAIAESTSNDSAGPVLTVPVSR